ncbi:MAG: hypothetical protein HUU08_16895 [Candidatus Brocadia sp.]|nr:hypothetical protein [Candidatus Brocadia sp.]
MIFDYVAIFLAITVMFFIYLYFFPLPARKGLDSLFHIAKSIGMKHLEEITKMKENIHHGRKKEVI